MSLDRKNWEISFRAGFSRPFYFVRALTAQPWAFNILNPVESQNDEAAQHRSVRFQYLSRHNPSDPVSQGTPGSFELKNLDESPELSNYVAGLNNGHLVMPAIQIDNEILINPSDQELGKAL